MDRSPASGPGQIGQDIARLEAQLARERVVFGADHPDYATTLNQLAAVYFSRGDYQACEPLCRQALTIRLETFGDAHPVVAESMTNLGLLLLARGDAAAAAPLLHEALENRRLVLGEQDPAVAQSLHALADLQRAVGRDAEAEPLLRRAALIERASLGTGHLHYARTLNQLADICFYRDDYAAARPLYEQVLSILRAALPSGSPLLGSALNNLANTYHLLDDPAAALPLYEEALRVRRAALGESHSETQASVADLERMVAGLRDRAQQELSRGAHVSAEPLLRQALRGRRAALGPHHPEVALDLKSLGEVLRSLGQYPEALTLLSEGLALRRAQSPARPELIGPLLNGVALVYAAMGQYEEARPLLYQGLEFARSQYGEEHPEFATVLANLAQLHHQLGDELTAEGSLRAALEIQCAAQGEDSLAVANLRYNIADCAEALGRTDEASTLLEQAASVQRRMLGKNHPDLARTLNSQALLATGRGSYVEAEALFRQALDGLRGTVGDRHPHVASCMINLAHLCTAAGDLERAEELLSEALAIQRETLGERHPSIVVALNQLSATCIARDRYAAALEAVKLALEIGQESLGENHPQVARAWLIGAEIYHRMAAFGKAEEFIRRALLALPKGHAMAVGAAKRMADLYLHADRDAEAEALYRRLLASLRGGRGENQPNPTDLAAVASRLATLLAKKGRFEEAITMQLDALDAFGAGLTQRLALSTERQRLELADDIHEELHRLLSMVLRHPGQMAIQAALDQVLQRRATTAEVLSVQREAFIVRRHPGLETVLRELQGLRAQIARTRMTGTAPKELVDYQLAISGWEARCNELERELARQVPEEALARRLAGARCAEVSAALPTRSALVEFVRVMVSDFRPRDPFHERPARYVALVLRSGEPEDVRLVDLGEAGTLERRIATLRAALTGEVEQRPGHPAEADRNIFHRQNPAAKDAPWDELYEVLVQPVLEAAGGARRLFLVPDGDICRLPFEVLRTRAGRYLIDDHEISYLGAGRDLLRFAAPVGEHGPPVVIADPAFDLAASTPGAAVKQAVGQRSSGLRLGLAHFGALAGARAEAAEIADLLQVRPWLGEEALEARLLALRSPRMLHIATHGFFLPDQRARPRADSFKSITIVDVPGLGKRLLEMKKTPLAADPGAGTIDRLQRLMLLENPLLRSGLALAGANTWLGQGALPPAAEDGILTAEDVTGMDLTGTELVVLSACETGLGGVHTGEGVFGLQRAFSLAGARTLVMSLWKVPDRPTRELMVNFYRRVLSGQPRASALRAAQLALKARYPAPRVWGAFICHGAPWPLPPVSGL